jgi:tryptophan synthase beta chain
VLLQDEDGQILEAHSISAGLDYPGVGPEHAWLRDRGRVRYESVTDREALAAFGLTRAARGDRARARVGARGRARDQGRPADETKDRVIVVNLSGRGDKDLDHVMSLSTAAVRS